MSDPREIDGVLVEWGDRLFYPRNRVVRPRSAAHLQPASLAPRAAAIRRRIEATVVRRAPQVMVKVTGGGRGMKAIAAHFRYIAKNGRLDIEDEQGVMSRGKDALRELTDDWRFGGSLIPDESPRREAFNIMLSMPRGTDALIVQRAAREFAQAEFADHKHVMVLHDHQANPHVHLSVRAESKSGKRLNPRKADLHRWREVFAERLRAWGIDAEASRQPTRVASRSYPKLWQINAAHQGRLRKRLPTQRTGEAAVASRKEAIAAWTEVGTALQRSGSRADRELAASIARFTDEQSLGIKRQPRSTGRALPNSWESARSR